MYVIGITGGAGSGKSTAVRYLTDTYGAALISTDEIGRRLIDPGAECYPAVISLFGRSMLLEDGSPDRAGIAERIFRNEYERKALDDVIHPAVRRETEKRLGAFRKMGSSAPEFALIESALLVEAHYGAICNEMWYIYAGEDTRYRRLREIRGWTDTRIRGVFTRQQSEESFRAHTDVCIDNDGSPSDCHLAIDRRIEEIRLRERHFGE